MHARANGEGIAIGTHIIWQSSAGEAPRSEEHIISAPACKRRTFILRAQNRDRADICSRVCEGPGLDDVRVDHPLPILTTRASPTSPAHRPCIAALLLHKNVDIDGAGTRATAVPRYLNDVTPSVDHKR
jgi:hypothetical protein